MSTSRLWGCTVSLLVLVLAISGVHSALAAIYDTMFVLDSSNPRWTLTEGGMYGARDPDSPTQSKQSFIEAEFRLTRSGNSTLESVVEFVIYRPEQLSQIGYLPPEANDETDRIFCCTEAIIAQRVSGCTKPGTLIVKTTQKGTAKKSFAEPIEIATTLLQPQEQVVEFDHNFYVHRTGIYTFMVSSCDKNIQSIQVDGIVAFRNPYGYLPGQIYRFLPLYSFLSLVYLVANAVWIVICATQFSNIMTLHFYMTGLFLLGFVEAMLFHHAYSHINIHGTPLCCPIPFALIIADIVSVLKIIPSKVLVLLISMGWGIVKATLGDDAKYVRFFAGIYCILALFHETLTTISHKNTVPMFIQLIIIVPVAIADAVLIVWIFSELSRTRALLYRRNQIEKIKLYRRYTAVLAIFVMAIICWSLWAVIESISSRLEDQWMYMHWKSYYLLGGLPPGGVVWDFMYFLLLLAIMILFFPSRVTASYEYRPSVDDESYVPLATRELNELRQDEDVEFTNKSGRQVVADFDKITSQRTR